MSCQSQFGISGHLQMWICRMSSIELFYLVLSVVYLHFSSHLLQLLRMLQHFIGGML